MSHSQTSRFKISLGEIFRVEYMGARGISQGSESVFDTPGVNGVLSGHKGPSLPAQAPVARNLKTGRNLLDQPIDLEPKSPVYGCAMELQEKKIDSDQPTYLVMFGGVEGDTRYPDGSSAEAHLVMNRFVWEKAGSPRKICVLFSGEEFTAISMEAYDRLREEAMKE